MANNVGRLGVVLGIETAEFVTGIGKAKSLLESFAQGAEKYGKLAATAMAAAAVSALHYADELNDVAKANEVALDTVYKLQQALVANGGTAETAGRMLSGFTKYVDEAAQGSFEAQQKFAKVGISLKDLATLSMEELFAKAVNGVSNLNDSITRNATSFAMFGKAIKGVDIKGVNEDLKNVNSTTEEQARHIADAAAVWDKLKQKTNETNAIIADAIGPTLLRTIEYIQKLETETGLLGDAFRITFQATAITLAKVLEQLVDIQIGFEQASLFVKAFIPGTEVDGKWDEWEQKRKANFQRFDDFYRKILNNLPEYPEQHLGGGRSKKSSSETGRPVTPGDSASAKRIEQLKAEIQMATVMQGIDRARQEIGLQMVYNKETELHDVLLALQYSADLAAIEEKRKKDLADNAANKNKIAKVEIDGLINTKAQTDRVTAAEKYKADLAKAESEREKKATEEQERLEEGIGKWQSQIAGDMRRQNEEQELQMQLTNERLGYESSLYKLSQDQRDILMQRFDLEAKITEYKRQQMVAKVDPRETEIQVEKMRELGNEQIRINQQTIEQQQTFEYGWDKAFQAYIDSANNSANTGRDVFNSVTSNMNSALDTFVRTGKFNFKSLAQSIIQDLIRIQLQAQATKMFSGFFGMITSALSPGMTGAQNDALAASWNAPAADGGNLDANKIGLVGERGPELFVPKTAGAIIPNNQLASALGGGQTVNYNGPYIASMNAIDTQSGIQFLAKNKQAVWGAYQSANRSVPVTR